MNYFNQELWDFTINPQKLKFSKTIPIKQKILYSFKAIILYFILAILVFIPILCLIKIINHFFEIDVLKIRDNHMKKAINSSYTLFIESLIGPTVEETLFRLWLSFKKIHIILSLITICLVLIIKLNNSYIYTVKINENFYYHLTEAIVSAFVLFGFFNLSFFKNLPNKYFKYIYWGSCITFGLTHITNFAPYKLSIIWAYPLFILPQLILGFILGFIRIKDGFFWALSIHCLINLTLSLIGS